MGVRLYGLSFPQAGSVLAQRKGIAFRRRRGLNCEWSSSLKYFTFPCCLLGIVGEPYPYPHWMLCFQSPLSPSPGVSKPLCPPPLGFSSNLCVPFPWGFQTTCVSPSPGDFKQPMCVGFSNILCVPLPWGFQTTCVSPSPGVFKQPVCPPPLGISNNLCVGGFQTSYVSPSPGVFKHPMCPPPLGISNILCAPLPWGFQTFYVPPPALVF